MSHEVIVPSINVTNQPVDWILTNVNVDDLTMPEFNKINIAAQKAIVQHILQKKRGITK